ncbi:MAG: 50S ribosomal protein L17 [Candidatus Pacebacteria bacterium]|nr:50S ribosomal protein L17 [Candidatus Paceibacterota bacterium]
MNHHKKNRKFGRVRNQRKALLKSLASSLIDKERIQTTEAKAKELRPIVEKLITSAKSGSLSSRRTLSSRVGVSASKKLVDSIAPKYKDRKGGYTRITKLETKRSDAAKMAQIEFV